MFSVRASALTLFQLLTILLALSCRKTDGNAISTGAAYTEGFDTAAAAAERGWIYINSSIEKGRGKWDNPSSPSPFDPYSTQATNTGYLFADYQSTASTPGIISNWVLSPVGTFHNGDRIVFYTRAQILYYNLDSTDFANRLQVRFSRSGAARMLDWGMKPANSPPFCWTSTLNTNRSSTANSFPASLKADFPTRTDGPVLKLPCPAWTRR